MISYNYTTSTKTILADMYTPVGVYMRLRDLYPQSALMESSDYHDQSNSRTAPASNRHWRGATAWRRPYTG